MRSVRAYYRPRGGVLLNHVRVEFGYFFEHFYHPLAVSDLVFAKLFDAVVVLNELSFLEERNCAISHLKSYKLVVDPLVCEIGFPNWNIVANFSYFTFPLSV